MAEALGVGEVTMAEKMAAAGEYVTLPTYIRPLEKVNIIYVRGAPNGGR